MIPKMWGFPKIRGTLLGGPHIKDYSILGFIMGSPYFGKVPCRLKSVYRINSIQLNHCP